LLSVLLSTSKHFDICEWTNIKTWNKDPIWHICAIYSANRNVIWLFILSLKVIDRYTAAKRLLNRSKFCLVNMAHRLNQLRSSASARKISNYELNFLFEICPRWSICVFVDNSCLLASNTGKKTDERRSNRNRYSTSTISRTVSVC